MRLSDLGEIVNDLIEEGHGGKVLKIAYQPSYPLESFLNHLFILEGDDCDEEAIYLCESPYEGNKYAPDVVFKNEGDFIE